MQKKQLNCSGGARKNCASKNLHFERRKTPLLTAPSQLFYGSVNQLCQFITRTLSHKFVKQDHHIVHLRFETDVVCAKSKSYYPVLKTNQFGGRKRTKTQRHFPITSPSRGAGPSEQPPGRQAIRFRGGPRCVRAISFWRPPGQSAAALTVPSGTHHSPGQSWVTIDRTTSS